MLLCGSVGAVLGCRVVPLSDGCCKVCQQQQQKIFKISPPCSKLDQAVTEAVLQCKQRILKFGGGGQYSQVLSVSHLPDCLQGTAQERNGFHYDFFQLSPLCFHVASAQVKATRT